MISASRGEIANAIKLKNILNENGYLSHIVDILELFGSTVEGLKEYYFPLSLMNLDLARAGYSIIEETGFNDVAANIRKKIQQWRPEILFILSWEYSLGALFATGIQFYWPTICKLYVHYENEIISQPLFEPSSLLITESLHGSKRAIASGIPPWRVMYFPHPITSLKSQKAQRVNRNKETIIIGAISRLVYGKNCEYALEVVKRLSDEGFPVLLHLKGDFEPFTQFPLYSDWLKGLITSLTNEKWLKWEREYTPYEEIANFYSSIDVFLHLSGFESGSNVVVEALGCEKPALILDIPTNHSLFKNAALFVKKEDAPAVSTFFSLPEREDLYQKLKLLISDEKARKEWAERGKAAALQRFSSNICVDRLSLLLQATRSYHSKLEGHQIKQKVEKLYLEDLKRFDNL